MVSFFLRVALIPIFVLSLLAGCSPTKNITYSTLFPAKSVALEKGTRIAIAPFIDNRLRGWSRPSDGYIENLFVSALASVEVKGGRYFELIDQSRVQAELYNQQVNQALLDQYSSNDAYADLADNLGLEYIISGSVWNNVSSTFIPHRHRYCAEKNPKGKCKSYREHLVYCEHRNVEVSVDAKLIDLRTSTIAFAKNIVIVESSNPCRHHHFNARKYVDGTRVRFYGNTRSILDRGMRAAVKEFTEYISPHYEQLHFNFLKKINFAKDSDQEAFKLAMKILRTNIQGACQIFLNLADNQGNDHYALVFNLGVCEEYKGSFQSASKYYAQVQQYFKLNLQPYPAWLINATGRSQNTERNKQKLEEQLQ